MKRVASYIVILLTIMTMCSCKTTKQVEYRDRYIDRYITQVVHDTLREKSSDSVYHEIIVRNDTVFETKYKERIKWRDRVVEKTDTVIKDSIDIQYIEKTIEVTRVPKIYKISMAVCVLLLIYAIVRIAIWLKMRSII